MTTTGVTPFTFRYLNLEYVFAGSKSAESRLGNKRQPSQVIRVREARPAITPSLALYEIIELDGDFFVDEFHFSECLQTCCAIITLL